MIEIQKKKIYKSACCFYTVLKPGRRH